MGSRAESVSDILAESEWGRSKSVCIGEEKLHYAAVFGNTVFCDHVVVSIFYEALRSNDSNQFFGSSS